MAITDDTNPEFDRVEGAPHPRDTATLYGQHAAEMAFLAAVGSGRLHHAWLITGPRGVGKATLAWRIARFLLTWEKPELGLFGDPEPLTSLDVPPDHPVLRRMVALSEPRLKLVRRDWDDEEKKPDSVITVKRIRQLKNFFQLSAADGGRRVVIIDSADDMNPAAANALLKLLEEPPPDAVLLLISHQPSRLLPTIRSRCRDLRCATLGPDDMALALSQAGADQANSRELAELAAGSVGEAIRLTNHDGLKLYADLVALMATLPRLDRPRALALTESASGKTNEARFDLFLRLTEIFLARLARTGLFAPPPEAAPGEAALLARLSPDAASSRHWAEVQQQLGTRVRHGKAVNLDPAALLLDMVLKLDQTAAQLAAR